MIPENFDGSSDPCALASRWVLVLDLTQRLVAMSSQIPGGLTIFSGMRTVAEQEALEAAGRPTAPLDLSTHLSCPATGADVRFTLGAANLELQSRVQFGFWAVANGLRWGGGSPVDPTTGIPSDWQHLDLGPRVLSP